MATRGLTIAVGLILCACFITTQAEFYPERIYKERKKTSLDFGWKFFKGTPTGTPSDSNFNDAGWATVNIPHSASYDDPEIPCVPGFTGGEAARYQGICWYRKYFTIPASALHTGKITIEFEGAMQVATAWLNGHPLGVHSSSGFTWFQFDISSVASLTGANVLAVKLDNTESLTIPPGRTPANGEADYYLYSGLYRNVWLVCTDKCSIPLWSQRISIPTTTASGASAQVHIVTPVTYSSSGTISVHYVVAFPSTNRVASGIMTKTVTSSSGTVTFDTLLTISSPSLWTEKTPNLYYLYTQVYKDGQVTDDYVDRFGVRWYTWTPAGGFALNGVFDTLKGTSLHQSIGWIENAEPTSRFFKEVGLVKQMGCNLIRCAHFPRTPTFYNACDELGMLAMVEVPTWGCCLTSGTYPDSLFYRLDTCMKEMIQVGYNHPSIIAWGVFNEPPSAFNAPQQIPSEDSVAHRMDATRYTYIASNTLNDIGIATDADIAGENYGEWFGAAANLSLRVINTEYHEGWMYVSFRGGKGRVISTMTTQFVDDLSAQGYAQQAWTDWLNLWATTRKNQLAGGCLWSFNDYWSNHGGGVYPMGVVDHYRIPKAIFYLYRKNYTGVLDSVPVPGLTPTALQLDCDTNSLIADSTDVSIVTASLRDANGVCVDNTNVGQNTDTILVNFTVSGPGNYFPPTGVAKLYGGKAGFMIKSTNSTGPITITATAQANGKELAANLTKTLTIQSVAADNSSLPFLTPVIYRNSVASTRNTINVKQWRHSIIVSFANQKPADGDVKIINMYGETIACPMVFAGKSLTISTKRLAMGHFLLSIKDRVAGNSLIKKIIVAQQ
jgi:beta-galactosidase